MSRRCNAEQRSGSGRTPMIVDDQKAVTEFLAHRQDHRHLRGDRDAHLAHFSGRDTALKMKRAVSLPYVDFSTPQLRLEACEKELRLNSHTAPGLYPRVRHQRGSRPSFIRRPGRACRRADRDGPLRPVLPAGRHGAEGRTDAGIDDETVSRMIAAFHREAPVIIPAAERQTWPRCFRHQRGGFQDKPCLRRRRNRKP